MTTVAQLIEKLLAYPQAAEVEVGVLNEGRYSTGIGFVPVDLDGIEVCDFTAAVKCRDNPSFAGIIIIELNGISEELT